MAEMRKGEFKLKSLESILAQCHPSGSECLLHPGSKDGWGYPRIQYCGKLYRANRLVWELVNARPVPTGLLVMHSCDTPACVAPCHLSVGTDADNHADKARKRRGPWGAKNGRHTNPEKFKPIKGTANGASKIDEDIVRKIRAHPLSSSKTATIFGVSPSLVVQIRSKKVWAWLLDGTSNLPFSTS